MLDSPTLRFSAPASLLLVFSSLSVACVTDHVEADIIQVEGPGSSGDDLAPFILSGAFVADKQLLVRLNGKDLDFGGQRLVVGGGGSAAGSIPAGDHVLELVEDSGRVVLRTEQLSFRPGYVNDILVYGDIDSLAYNFYSHEWSKVADGKVRANFFNATMRRVSGSLALCKFDAQQVNTCEQLSATVTYGTGWTGEVDPGTHFEFTPNDPDSSRLEFSSSDHGDQGYTPDRMTRVNAYYPQDWVDFTDTECPGCTAAFEHTEDMFIPL